LRIGFELMKYSLKGLYKPGACGSSCNPSYFGSRDQEDLGFKDGHGQIVNSKMPNTQKKGWWNGLSGRVPA
jgi:hypothetical protein